VARAAVLSIWDNFVSRLVRRIRLAFAGRVFPVVQLRITSDKIHSGYLAISSPNWHGEKRHAAYPSCGRAISRCYKIGIAIRLRHAENISRGIIAWRRSQGKFFRNIVPLIQISGRATAARSIPNEMAASPPHLNRNNLYAPPPATAGTVPLELAKQ